MIEEIDFDRIYSVWKNYLWPMRTSKIESNSAMNFLGGHDLYNMNSKPTFFGYFINDMLVGVNSGHMCKENQYRSRGLFVFEAYRGLGIGKELLIATINQGKKENAEICWSYPKKTSWKTYLGVGFELKSNWVESELGHLNAYCMKYY